MVMAAAAMGVKGRKYAVLCAQELSVRALSVRCETVVNCRSKLEVGSGSGGDGFDQMLIKALNQSFTLASQCALHALRGLLTAWTAA